ncbi:ferrous iron transport protein B [Fusibacter paucivorans]|uniref:Ferrous iron transport protein B n=1 Tax=Fusibacter paucivorans TaxID=76009 RepID=A0ABS5PKI3_9FIRM|nr:ferrous iron transport protein B [Fusibacter paucivorans]MBS7525613.1 ferrous iron transport protein B [Fusibacter paucivorans]
MKQLNIAIAGNPNSGKTTLFNTLTGGNHYVGNWPGVTVEKKEGSRKFGQWALSITDLPGIYSLEPYSIEEIVTKAYIIDEKPDLVINVVDGTLLERNLYLTTQLMALDVPMVLAVNMMDELERRQIKLDAAALSKSLGVEVVMISAQNKHNIDKLLERAVTVATDRRDVQADQRRSDVVDRIERDATEEDASQRRYAVIQSILSVCLAYQTVKYDERTAKLDRFFMNEAIGLPIFFLIMAFIFYMTFEVGGIFLDVIDRFFTNMLTPAVVSVLGSAGVHDWLIQLIGDGIIGGVGGVLTFVPNIAILFLFISFLEDTGYMARVAYIMDRWMTHFGLNGKTFVPMILGFGCNVPAIMATRTIENEKDRLLSILINPFVSCGARFPVYVLFASVFFKGYETIVTFSLYALGIVIALLAAVVFRKTLFRENESHFIMELPVYRMPSVKTLGIHVWERVKGYIVKAGTVIFAASVILWLLLNFNLSGMTNIDSSFGAAIGRAIAPIFKPLGFGTWEVALSLLTGMVAKEVIISNMAIVLGSLDGDASFLTALQSLFNSVSAYAFLVFVLLYTPCIAVVGVIKRETNSWKWTFFSVTYQFVVAWIVAFIFYRIGLILF